MSGLGGILRFDGAPIEPETLASLGRALNRRGLDGGREMVIGPLGMAYRAFHTTPESRLERQPLAWPGRLILGWDGRLDNREDLIRELGNDLRGGERTDVAIVMAAYLRWDDGCWVKLIGDFALALWNEPLQKLTLVRDVVGARTLYYHVNTERIAFSTDLSALLDVEQAPFEVNDEYIAGFLGFGPDVGLTPYVNVHAVKPAHYVAATVDGLVSERRFWSLNPQQGIRYNTDAEYEEHFRHLFRDAVRVRLRSDKPVFSELSGGLDSSSIVCMADQVLAADEAQAPRLETVSYVFDDSPTSDERRFIRCVEDQRGRTGYHINEQFHTLLSLPPDLCLAVAPESLYAWSGTHRAVDETMRSSGARVLLSGKGGDELLHSANDPSPELSDALHTLQIGKLFRQSLNWAKVVRKPWITLCWQEVVKALRRQTAGTKTMAPWLKAVPARREAVQKFGLPSQKYQADGFFSVVRSIAIGVRQTVGEMEITYPYLHRPFVEFLQAIPIDQKLRPNESRSLMRRSLKGVLPRGVCQRRGKGHPAEAIFRIMRNDLHHFESLLDNGRWCSEKSVDVNELRLAIGRAKAGVEPYSAALVKTIALELWLRAQYLRCASPTSGVRSGGAAGTPQIGQPRSRTWRANSSRAS